MYASIAIIANIMAIIPSETRSLLTVGPTYSNLLYSISLEKALFKDALIASTAICCALSEPSCLSTLIK